MSKWPMAATSSLGAGPITGTSWRRPTHSRLSREDRMGFETFKNQSYEILDVNNGDTFCCFPSSAA
jgi:hypothetical protein